ncbi:MAG: hypothetical protein V7K77_10435 [Nostoc sp.]|uniref:hypothetical protein n=1 Tax=Nostoc sp. TaxID=1180 RepID=UPI002FF87168
MTCVYRGDDCVYPGVIRSFVPGGCYAEFCGDSFEAGEALAQLREQTVPFDAPYF